MGWYLLIIFFSTSHQKDVASGEWNADQNVDVFWQSQTFVGVIIVIRICGFGSKIIKNYILFLLAAQF